MRKYHFAAIVTLLGLGAGCGSSDEDPPPYKETGDAGNDARSEKPAGCLPSESTACNVFVSPTAGNDANPGTRELPVKTLKKALSIVKSGQSVSLADGTYDAANGETWPETVPDGVTLDASSQGAVVAGDSTKIGLQFAGSGRIRAVSFDGFRAAVAAVAGTLQVNDVRVKGGGGLFLDGTVDARLRGVTMTEITKIGIGVQGKARLDMDGGSIAGSTVKPDCLNLGGIFVDGEATADVRGVSFVTLGTTPFAAVGNSSVTLSNSTLAEPMPAQTCPSGQIAVGDNGNMTIEGVRLSNPGGIGLFLIHPTSKATVRRTTIQNTSNGIQSHGQLDLEDSIFVDDSSPIWLREGSQSKITRTTIARSSYGIKAEGGAKLTLRKSDIRASSFAIAAFNSNADLGTADEFGDNTILGDEIGLWVQYGKTLVHAAGNRWWPHVQGADVFGAYGPQLVEKPQGPDLRPANFWLTVDCKIQF